MIDERYFRENSSTRTLIKEMGTGLWEYYNDRNVKKFIYNY